jgi:hypothetical protein
LDQNWNEAIDYTRDHLFDYFDIKH